MKGEKIRLRFSKEGVKIEKWMKSVISNDSYWKTVEEIEWGSFPINDILMEVTNVEPVLSNDNARVLEELVLEANRLESINSNERESKERFWQEIKENLDIEKIDDDVSLNSMKSGKENLLSLVRYVWKNGYLEEEDLPIPVGHKRVLLTKQDKDQEGNPISNDDQYETLDDIGLHVLVRLSTSQVKEYIEKIGNICIRDDG